MVCIDILVYTKTSGEYFPLKPRMTQGMVHSMIYAAAGVLEGVKDICQGDAKGCLRSLLNVR